MPADPHDPSTVPPLCADALRRLTEAPAEDPILRSVIEHGPCRLFVSGAWFVMSGPNGIHRLTVEATDLARLNAHWRTFASHPLNARKEAA